MMIQELAQKLNGWLGPIFLFFRHVKIIDENNIFFSDGGSENSSSYFLQFKVDGVLGLVGRSLSTKCNGNVLINLSHP